MTPRTVEVLQFAQTSQRAGSVLAALTQSAARVGVTARRSTAYRGDSDLLLLWGPGAPDRFEPMRRQIAAGGHVIALDLAYWQRDRKFRVSIDAAHPQAWVDRIARPPDRLVSDGVVVTSQWDRSGPVVVAGIGEKAGVQYGLDTVRRWETDAIARVTAAGWRVRYRPKRRDGWAPPDAARCEAVSIDEALRGASAALTWHSNVAVDALRIGLPAVCMDGAASAACPSVWSCGIEPLPRETREQFLANLAWFQWAPSEAVACWRFLLEMLS